MTKSPQFLAAFFKTMKIEGHYSNDKGDPGGETYRGVSRVYWPHWAGWRFVDSLNFSPELDGLVEDFYLINFWNRIQGDKIAGISTEIADEVFDTAVNRDVPPAVSILQDALSLLNNNARIYPDLLIDGLVGWKTLESLRLYCASRPPAKEVAVARLLRVMNCLQGGHYIAQMRKHPDREKFRGWFDRI